MYNFVSECITLLYFIGAPCTGLDTIDNPHLHPLFIDGHSIRVGISAPDPLPLQAGGPSLSNNEAAWPINAAASRSLQANSRGRVYRRVNLEQRDNEAG